MTREHEALKLAQVPEQIAKYVAALVQGTHEITSVTIRPKREWVGLTLVEVNEIEKNGDFWEDHTPFDFFQAIEAKLKERNS
jgi:hypothetical protein